MFFKFFKNLLCMYFIYSGLCRVLDAYNYFGKKCEITTFYNLENNFRFYVVAKSCVLSYPDVVYKRYTI